MAKALNVSNQQITKIKVQLGYTKNQALYTEDIDKFKVLKQELCKKGGKSNPDFPKYYKQAMYLIEKSGFVSYAELMRIFKVTHISHVESYFESQGTYIYDEDIKTVKRNAEGKKYTCNVKIFRLNKDYWNDMEKDNLLPKNGFIRTGQTNVFRSAI